MPIPEDTGASGPVERELTATPAEQPPASAFAGAIGQQVEGVGRDFGKLYEEERQHAIEARVLKANTTYLSAVNDALDPEKGLTQYHGEEALKHHQDYIDHLSDLRDKLSQDIGSRHGQQIFEDSSLRTMRVAFGEMNGYARTQARVAYDNATKGFIDESTRHASTLGLELGGTYSGRSKEISDFIGLGDTPADGSVRAVAYNHAIQFKFGEAEAHEYADKAVGQVTQAFLMSAAKSGSPGAAAAFKDLGSLIPADKQAALEGILRRQHVEGNVLQNIVEKVRGSEGGLINFSRDPRLDGLAVGVNWTKVDAEVAKLPEDQRIIAAEWSRRVQSEEKARVTEITGQALEQIKADGKVVNGVFFPNMVQSADAINTLKVNSPSMWTALQMSEQKGVLSTGPRAAALARINARHALNQFMTDLLDPEQHPKEEIDGMTPAGAAMLASKYDGADETTLNGAMSYVQKLHKNPADDKLQRSLRTYARAAVLQAYPNDQVKQVEKLPALLSYLQDQHDRGLLKPGADVGEVAQKALLKNIITDPGILYDTKESLVDKFAKKRAGAGAPSEDAPPYPAPPKKVWQHSPSTGKWRLIDG